MNGKREDNRSEIDDPLRVGVIGVGSMGQNHTRVYDSLPDATLVGVSDRDRTAATEVADQYGTEVLDRETLLSRVDAVSVVVPTDYHFPVVQACLEAGVDVLVEKPFVAHPDQGHELLEQAEESDATIQVGHVERYNPAVRALPDIIQDETILALDAERLGPSRERDIRMDVVFDLMIHDIDVVQSLVDGDIVSTTAVSPVAHDGNLLTTNEYTSATLQYDTGTVATLTASRTTQETTRRLTITTETRYIEVDYLEQAVEVHRDSVPEYIEQNGDIRYRHESIIEVPYIENMEPLKNELTSFLEAVRTGTRPDVDGSDGLRAVEIAQAISDRTATTDSDSGD